MNSAIYTGWVRHRRYAPREHQFTYRVFMPYLRLDELPQLFDGCWGWSARRPALAWFRRADFLGDPQQPLEEAVRDRVQDATGERPAGPVFLLGNLRYFGFQMNPVCCYYCFEPGGEKLSHLVAEVTNTPWKQRHSYVLTSRDGRGVRQTFDKQFHVSPFHPMDTTYQWRSNLPGERLALHLACEREGDLVFDATLGLQRQALAPQPLARLLASYPFMTGKVAAGIYWQALRLWLKNVPFYPHPDKPAARP